MVSIYRLKPAFQATLRPISNQLAKHNITANQVTLFTLTLTIICSGILALIGPGAIWIAMPILLFVRMALNAIDGMLAREHSMKSDYGYVLNEVCDIVSDAAIYLSFIAIPGFNIYVMFGFVLLSWLSEVVAILVFHIKDERANHGPLGKSDRAFLFGLLGLLVGLHIDLSVLGIWIMLIAYLAVIYTIYNRLRTI
ncbi:CDP-alcohol phosphatidyltransferase family protein [Vibrio sp. CAIM 722]|uniref:CDP-alcohol phosphatidyltransferase family protein n=1 Tax=Vibrio eleionomae TaxID=2653505 RepID=A0A7X4LKU6_9VIBR|nr:CDP-alcohol phosphatidyltransferase family protein [Vibrio eleionomae]